ncbi:hypothetical protein Q8W16_13810 [Photobacterium damselae subsp. piscicida]|nr:hypothetical protein [Photobacterium damselae subsp. piscicida]
MKYKRILSQSHIVLKEFYVDHHLIVNLKNGDGDVCINGQSITISSNATLVIPKFSHISCTINQKDCHKNIELQLLMVGEDTIAQSFKYMASLKQPNVPTANCMPVYHLNETPNVVEQNFQLFQQSLPAVADTKLEKTFLTQSLFFVLLALNESGIDVFNVYRFNYDEPKERTIARLITQKSTT